MSDSADENSFPDETLHLTPRDGIIILLIVQSFYTIILTPLSIYHAYRFYTKSKEGDQDGKPIAFFANRHPRFVMVTIAIYNIYPLIVRPIADFTWLFHITGSDELSQPTLLMARLLTNSIQFVAWIAVARLWLLYYDYNHKVQLLSSKWKAKIQKKDVEPWTLRYKWLGSEKILFIGWVVISILLSIYLMYVTCYFYSLFMTLLGMEYADITDDVITIYCKQIILILRCGAALAVDLEVLNYMQLTGLLPFIMLLILAFNIRKCRDQFAIQS